MGDVDTSDEQELAAGDFSSWLFAMQGAIRGDRASDVPCGDCAACCTSSQFVHIAPDEADTLAHIPASLLFPAPGLPQGHVLLGYDERGHCPMLIDGQCSIYQHRPRTCRTYDCRVIPASGLTLDDDERKAAIARQVRRWRFTFTDTGSAEHDAVRAAATFLEERRDVFASGTVPTDATQRAVLAIEIHGVFLRHNGETGMAAGIEPDAEAVSVEVRRRTRATPA